MKKDIQFHLDKANELAESELERIARDILKNHPELKEFIMAMGSWFFTTRKRGYGKENIGDYHEYEYLKPLKDFINEWDSMLKLTGSPMRFTANGKKITDW